MKILDVGAGTGLVGEILRGRGYTHIDALDICQEMLDVAKEKNIYNKYICAALSAEPVSEIATGEYDGLISSGTFTEGHVGPGGFREVVRQVKSGNQIYIFLFLQQLSIHVCLLLTLFDRNVPESRRNRKAYGLWGSSLRI